MDKIIEEIETLAQTAEQGGMRPSQAYTQLYAIESALKEAKQQVSDLAFEELDQYARGDEPVHYGLRPTLSSKTTWKYDHDPGWLRYKQILKQREDKMKTAYNMRNEGGFIDENGEEIPPADQKLSRFIKVEREKQ